jgi:hypothetical protein
MTTARVQFEAVEAAADESPAVEVTWRPEVDTRRLRRIAEILADILDNGSTPGEGRRP